MGDGIDDTSDLLERAKAGGPIEPVVSAHDERSSAEAPAWRRALMIGTVLVALGGGVTWLLSSGEETAPFVYSEPVHTVAAEPAAYLGRTLRVEGLLKNGSILFREDPCEWRFVIEGEGQEMPVEFPQCVVPDMFRDGMGISVVVEGRLREDGSFLASQIIPRCPSRYEMEQRGQAGEAMPHAPTPAS
jgi:cytochrome c-type biogenesis protein CcmE